MKVLFLVLTLWISGNLAPADILQKATGIWTVQVTDAPEGFQHYTVHIKKSGNQLKADIKGGDADVKDQIFTVKDNVLSASVYIGEYVDLRIWEEKNGLTGSAQTSQGTFKLVFKKVVKGK